MRRNLTIVLLTVMATLLGVLVVQNLKQPPYLLSQLGGGGGGSVGTIGVATGSITGSGDAAAFWLYDPAKTRLVVYVLGNRGLELRAARSLEYDLQLMDFTMKTGRAPGVRDVMKMVSSGAGGTD